MTSKSPEQIMEEFRKLQEDEWWDMEGDEKEDWLRSSLASVLLWAAEELPKYTFHTDPSWETNSYSDARLRGQEIGRNQYHDEARSLLIEKAKEITNE